MPAMDIDAAWLAPTWFVDSDEVGAFVIETAADDEAFRAG